MENSQNDTLDAKKPVVVRVKKSALKNSAGADKARVKKSADVPEEKPDPGENSDG